MKKTGQIILFYKTVLMLLFLSACTPSASDQQSDIISVGDRAHVQFEGLDVSHFQGEVDWSKVAGSGKKFAIAKATQGITYIDPQFSQNWSEIKQASMIRGAYHFFVPTDDASEQAKHFIATVTLESGDLAPVLDIEENQGESSEELQSQIKIWLQMVEKHYGIKPIIYSDYSFLRDNLGDDFCDYPLWMADYSKTPPDGVGCWTHWSILQYSDSGNVDGINGNVDLDRFVGTSKKWHSLLVK